MLILVLGVGAIVSVIGLSSLVAVRLQHRTVQLRLDAGRAQLAADAGLHVIHARLSEDADWRTRHHHGQWNPVEDWGDGLTIHYKLLDDSEAGDVELDDDESDPARLVVRVASGGAVRLASVQIAAAPQLGPELIQNPDTEAGTSGYGSTSSSASLRTASDAPHGGSLNLVMPPTFLNIGNWRQHLDGKLKNNTTYRLAAWMRTGRNRVNVRFGLHQQTNSGSSDDRTVVEVDEDWSLVIHTLTTDFSSTPSSLYLFGGQRTGSTDLHFDDVSVREVLTPSLPVTAGSYRRELDD